MRQHTPAGFERFGKTTRRARFLADMDRIVPWADLQALVEPWIRPWRKRCTTRCLSGA